MFFYCKVLSTKNVLDTIFSMLILNTLINLFAKLPLDLIIRAVKIVQHKIIQCPQLAVVEPFFVFGRVLSMVFVILLNETRVGLLADMNMLDKKNIMCLLFYV